MKRLLLLLFILAPLLGFSQTYISIDTVRAFARNQNQEVVMISESAKEGLFEFNKEATTLKYTTKEKVAYYQIKSMIYNKEKHQLEYNIIGENGDKFEAIVGSKSMIFSGKTKEGLYFAIEYTVKRTWSEK